ncbi:aspartate aminotransferase family protein [Acidithrix ferrooxidans]|uniref:Acetylornithine aminotransferase n=1 Tax=Acidithrix ferrooxidans TaxID=1280514 RepID=A0A0D8HF36_9ACTN|nr:aminotransferase class III-fold pyridoxal phosphate-dependent enzyme [Acidithrix ferrooxidans]KJF16580.1 acetylornithine aminotransferase [Acidithrix ferrooxidans]
MSDYEELLAFSQTIDAMEGTKSYLMANYGEPRDAFVRGEGSWLYRSDESAVLDFLGGIAVCSLGHCPRSVSDAIATQAHKLIHTSNFFANENGPKVAYLIDRLITGDDAQGGRVIFSNSGAEANEAALKLARRYGGPQRTDIVALNGSFHGRTYGALSATGQVSKQIPFMPLVPGFSHIEPGDVEQLREALSRPTVAALIIETIQGEAGVIPLHRDYLALCRELTIQYGVLLIIDEVQSGFGRCGNWFDHHRGGISPDMVTMAKAMASGVAVGALWARNGIWESFAPGDHGTTFGGSPLAMAGALATITTMIEEDVVRRAIEMGSYLKKGLSRIEGISLVRGEGLLIGFGLRDQNASKMAKRCLELGLIVNPIGDSIIRLAPSLLVTAQEIDIALGIIASAIDFL